MTPPQIIKKLGVSFVPNQTQNGPRAVSNNIKRPIFEACVYRVAKVKQANDIGSIINPDNEIDNISPWKSKPGDTISRPIKPLPKALIPVTVIAGIFGWYLNKTRLKPKDAAAPIPHIVPIKTLPWGAFSTFSPCATEIPTPIKARHAVIQVDLVVFSPRKNIENTDAKIGDVARVNNIKEAEVSAIP